jgi:sulfate transport system ATP-binding protein
MDIILQQVSKSYQDCNALLNISLSIKEGELIALIGPSGSGKTTLLKIIAGLEIPSQGQISINNVNVTKLLPKDRRIGFVFQHYALFKHMSVFDNIAFGYKVSQRKNRLNQKEIKDRVNELLKLVQLENLNSRYPHELSGGQKQRVALARALAVEPKILLLDEPFAALDAKLKLELRRWLRKLKKMSNITIILVTHDQEEALDIADRVVVLNNGNIEQVGTPKELYHFPDTPFVYNFLGHYNAFRAVKDANGKVIILKKQEYALVKPEKWYHKHKLVSSIANLFKTHNPQESFDQYFEVFVRPHDMEVAKIASSDEYLPATITHINLASSSVKIELESIEYDLIQVDISQEAFNNLPLKNGELVYVRAKQFTMFSD